jgi:enoyl-CoA hydratase/carnithine racemase
MPIDVDRDGDVIVARWGDGENRFNLDTIAALHAMLGELELVSGPLALVLTGDGKFFSNGLDLDRFAGNPDEFAATAEAFHRLLGRLLVFPAYTVAAINGHAYAAGAMLSCAFDHRVMREDRGYWCLNEADIGLPLTEQMASVVLARLPQPVALEAMLTARRYAAHEAVAAGIVEEAAAQSAVLGAAVARAAIAATKDRKVVTIHKRIVFSEVARSCGWIEVQQP